VQQVDTGRLEGIKLLGPLTAEEYRSLEKRCAWRRYKANEQILDRSSISSDVLFVVEGRVHIVNYSLSGREIAYATVSAGGYFGELSAIDGAPRSASVVALEETVTATLPPADFVKLLKENPDFSFAITKRLVEIIRGSTSRIMDLSTLGAPGRIHAELLRLAGGDREGRTATVSPAPRHADIASRVSTTRETVARVLSELSRKGLISRNKGTLVVHDVDRLESLVDELKH